MTLLSFIRPNEPEPIIAVPFVLKRPELPEGLDAFISWGQPSEFLHVSRPEDQIEQSEIDIQKIADAIGDFSKSGNRPSNNASGNEIKMSFEFLGQKKVILDVNTPDFNERMERFVVIKSITSITFEIARFPFRRPSSKELAEDDRDGVRDLATDGYRKAFISFQLKSGQRQIRGGVST